MFTIEDIIATLNHVEVRGKDNMDRLLGAILALEAFIDGMNNEAKIKAEEEAKAKFKAEEITEGEGE